MISVRANTTQQLNNGHVTPFKKQHPHQPGVLVLPPRLLNQANTPGNNGGGSSSKFRRQQQQHQQLYKANGPTEQASPSHQLAKLHHQQQQQQHQKVRFSPNPKSMHQNGGNAMSNNNHHQHGNINANQQPQQQHRHSPYNNKGEKIAAPQINSESHFAASKFCTTPAPSTLPAPPEKWLALGRKASSGTTSPARATGNNSILNELNLMQALITPVKVLGGATTTENGHDNHFANLLAKIKPPSPPMMLMPQALPPTSHLVPSFPDDPAVLRIETGRGQLIPIGLHG